MSQIQRCLVSVHFTKILRESYYSASQISLSLTPNIPLDLFQKRSRCGLPDNTTDISQKLIVTLKYIHGGRIIVKRVKLINESIGAQFVQPFISSGLQYCTARFA